MFQTIKTNVPVAPLGLKAGARGVIVDEYQQPYHAYEIEFIDDDGETIGLLSMRPEEIVSDSQLRKAA